MTSDGEAINLREWVRARVPAPPAALAQRLDEIVGETMARNRDALPETLNACAERVLAVIGDDRSTATDLLAADALITYAMEAAAEYCLDIGSIAADAAARLSSVSSRGEQP